MSCGDMPIWLAFIVTSVFPIILMLIFFFIVEQIQQWRDNEDDANEDQR